ncbi:hypothetical protein B0O99DRAFT_671823 [Bisporella sp. PMI_857]|nr:hypothetical protein B0O99DRAFT_671823 [Bisporella sp. PMI_857]
MIDSGSGLVGTEQAKRAGESLQKKTEKQIIQDLKDALDRCQARANCKQTPILSPFTQDTQGSTPSILTLEPSESNSACSPATFGFEGGDMLDEGYRKASKLDRKDFCVSFHPYDFGIIDAITQTLLPGIADALKETGHDGVKSEHWGVAAELYKLNIYSRSGKFHKHVDTPWSASQFGSLVVCVPYSHQGGQLTATHKGQKSVFDWAEDHPNQIKLVAFYSDCEHEVLEVTSDHRITLTYNLYVNEHIGGVLRGFPTADPSSYPLFESVKGLLQQPSFLPDGGILGFHCTHRYAHTSQSTNELMPYALKGVDAILYMVFRTLGVTVRVRPMLRNEAWQEEIESKVYKARYPRYTFGSSRPSDDIEEEIERIRERENAKARFGNYFHPLTVVDGLNECLAANGVTEFYQSHWSLEEYEDIIWLNAMSTDCELAIVHMKYGNEASMGMCYSSAVIVIDFPSRAERMKGGHSE